MPEYSATRLLSAIRNAINYDKHQLPISLHEPTFEDTNAWAYVKDCIDTAWVSSAGKWVSHFEELLCGRTGANHVVAVNNGTVALRLALHIVGVKQDEEVILPPLSFVATANAVSHLGAVPHFVDIESETLGLSPRSLSERLNLIAYRDGNKVFNRHTGRRIAAVLPVHIFGNPANIIKLKNIADEWNIPLIEDAAEALGS